MLSPVFRWSCSVAVGIRFRRDQTAKSKQIPTQHSDWWAVSGWTRWCKDVYLYSVLLYLQNSMLVGEIFSISVYFYSRSITLFLRKFIGIITYLVNMNLFLASCFLFVFFFIRYSLIFEGTSKGWDPTVIGEVPLEKRTLTACHFFFFFFLIHFWLIEIISLWIKMILKQLRWVIICLEGITWLCPFKQGLPDKNTKALPQRDAEDA